MNRFDVENLNNSLAGLSQTILQNRMNDERKGERAQDRTDRLSENAQARTDRLGEQSKLDEYRQAMLKERMTQVKGQTDAGAAKIAEQLKTHGEQALEKTFETISKGVANGTIKPETGNSMLKAAVGKIPPTLQDNPLVQMISSSDFALQAPDKNIQPLQKQFGTTSVIYNPNTGAFHVEGQTKDKAAQVDWPIGPEGSTGVPAGRIRGPVTDPSVRAMMGTNAPPMPGGTPLNIPQLKPGNTNDPLNLYGQ